MSGEVEMTKHFLEFDGGQQVPCITNPPARSLQKRYLTIKATSPDSVTAPDGDAISGFIGDSVAAGLAERDRIEEEKRDYLVNQTFMSEREATDRINQYRGSAPVWVKLTTSGSGWALKIWKEKS